MHHIESTLKTLCERPTGFELLLKNSGSDMGSMLKERIILERSPLGASLVILTPFCSTDTGKLGEG